MRINQGLVELAYELGFSPYGKFDPRAIIELAVDRAIDKREAERNRARAYAAVGKVPPDPEMTEQMADETLEWPRVYRKYAERRAA